MAWTDMYDIEDVKGSKYIHSHWENFDYIMKGNINNMDIFAQEIKSRVESKLKTVIFRMIDREIDWMKRMEFDFLNAINEEHGTTYKTIYEFLSAFQAAYSYVVGRNLFGDVIKIKVNTAKYKKILSSERDRLRRLRKKDKSITDEKSEQMVNKAVKERLAQVDWVDDLLEAVSNVYTALDNKVLSFLDGVNLPKEIDAKTEKMFQELRKSINYGMQQDYIESSAGVFTDLTEYYSSDKGEIRHLIDMLSYTNQERLFYEVVDKANFASPFGNYYEDAIPELFASSTLAKFVLPSHKKYKGAGEAFKDFNITDQVLGEINSTKRKVLIGASLKLKQDHMTKNSYVVPNLWSGKLTGAKTPEEQEIYNQAVPYKNIINWVKNNVATLSSFALDKETSNTAIDAIIDMEKTLGVWIMLPRFLNGFLRELGDGDFSSAGYGSWASLDPAVFTMFVISNDEIFLTSDMLKILRNSFIEAGPGSIKSKRSGAFSGDARGWANKKARPAHLKKDGAQLWKDKENAWDTLQTVTYKGLMNNPQVASTLDRINLALEGRAGIAKAYFTIQFDRLI